MSFRYRRQNTSHCRRIIHTAVSQLGGRHYRVVGGRSVYVARKNMGVNLAKEAPVDADVVVPVPDGGTPAALGYAQQSGIPFEYGIIRNHYVGRTFIEPTQQIRAFGVKLKHSDNLCYAYMELGDNQKALDDCNASLANGSIPDAFKKKQELITRLSH